MGRTLRIGRELTALFVCAAFLPLTPIVQWVAEPKPVCVYHGEACSCPKKCVLREGDHQHKETALPSCHREQDSASSSAQGERAETGPRFMSCALDSQEWSVGPGQPYLGTTVVKMARSLSRDAVDPLLTNSFPEAFFAPPTPPPEA